MFNDKYGLTKAVLEGRKRVTRRMVPEKLLEAYYDYDDYVNAVAPRDIPCSREYEEEFFLRRSRYKVGDIVAVAQAYKDTWGNPDFLFSHKSGWNNKMFVAADLMPHQIRITNIRVERLQDISDEDCLMEGITTMTEGKREVGNGYGWDAKIDALKRDTFFSPRDAFAALIDKISGKGTFENNPWVFVYEFELVK